MPSADNDFETRLTAVERELARLREKAAITGNDAAGARVLAAGADRDVSEVRAELRAHTQGLNALRETQVEQGGAITGLRRDLDGLRREVREGFTEMRDGFGTVATGMAQLTALLTNITGEGG
ncbi:MAG TPA: hypothetical protein VIY28_10145 [Pseudonocardiaceae bacterium]